MISCYMEKLEKTKYYASQTAIQESERGSLHVLSHNWIFNAPNIQNEEAYTELVENIRNSQLPDPKDEPEFFD